MNAWIDYTDIMKVTDVFKEARFMADQICADHILSEEYMDIIITQERLGPFKSWSDESLCRNDLGLIYDSIHVPTITKEALFRMNLDYSMIPSCYTLIDMEAMNQSGVTGIQNYPGLELKGEDVLIGFIDTGIDYENNVFRKSDGSTRIEAIWDQTIQEGPPPSGFLIGTEYTREHIDEALQSESPDLIVPTKDDHGHGTYVASLAAGGENVSEQFLGAAPEASIAMVKVKQAKAYLKDYYQINPDAVCYQENDLMLGLRYLHELATRLHLPLVICIAMGTNLGDHTGISPLCRMIDDYATFSNRVIVIGGGNEGDKRHHYYGKFNDMREVQEVEISVGADVAGFTMELWTTIPNIMSMSITSPSGESISNIPVQDGFAQLYNIVFGATTIGVRHYLNIETVNAQLILVQMHGVAQGVWRFTIAPLELADGVFHMWLPVTEFLTGDIFFLRSNPDVTLTEPSNTESAITVGYYNGADNATVASTGKGFTRTDGIKPGLVSLGINIRGAAPDNRFVTRSGASAAVAIATGVAALLVEWALYKRGETDVDSLLIKNYLILGAQKNPVFSYPNPDFGYGKLDLYNTFLKLGKYF